MMMLLATLILVTLVGRLFDRVLTGLHLPAIICVIALLVTLLRSGISVLNNRIGAPQLALLAWMFICVPFSTWKGGSAVDAAYFAFFALMWLPISVAPRHLKDLKRLIVLIMLLNVATLLLTTKDSGGRLQGAGGSYANSEDIALIGLLTIPYFLLIASYFRMMPIRIAIVLPSFVLLAYSVASTGSRAALLAGGVMMAIYFWQSSASRKIALAAMMALAVPAVVLVLPDQVFGRLATIVDALSLSSPRQMEVSDEAMDSALGRRQLLIDSIRMTFENPLFGLGPGQFAQVRWQELRHTGVHAAYLVTHNAYTQISSENGIPGMILFLVLVYRIHRTIQTAKRLNAPGSHKDWEAGHAIASVLELNFLAIVTMGFFLANAQYIFWYLTGGLALALERISLRAIAVSAPPAQAMPPAQSHAPSLVSAALRN